MSGILHETIFRKSDCDAFLEVYEQLKLLKQFSSYQVWNIVIITSFIITVNFTLTK